MANNNAPVEKVLAGLPKVIDQALEKGYRVRGYVSCVMTDPYAGATDPADVVKVARRLLDMGCYEVSLGDTTGEGNPDAWRVLWGALVDAGVPVEKIAVSEIPVVALELWTVWTRGQKPVGRDDGERWA